MQSNRSGQQVNEEIEITAKFRRDELLAQPRREPKAHPDIVPFVRFGAKTDLGNVRENNEDKFDFFEPTEPTLLAERGCVYAVCDGMGGHSAGQIASELALKTFLKAYYDMDLPDIDTALGVAVQAANALVRRLSRAGAAWARRLPPPRYAKATHMWCMWETAGAILCAASTSNR